MREAPEYFLIKTPSDYSVMVKRYDNLYTWRSGDRLSEHEGWMTGSLPRVLCLDSSVVGTSRCFTHSSNVKQYPQAKRPTNKITYKQ